MSGVGTPPTPAIIVSEATVVSLAETGSTNSEAMLRALAGQPLPFWVVAERQTAGRGRSGRGWSSQPGNFHASLALGLDCAPVHIAGLSLVAGVAVAELLREKSSAAGLNADAICIKWPNDILVRRRKAGGILIESSALPATPLRVAIIGIGINLVYAPDVEGREITDLASHGIGLSPDAVVRGLSGRFNELLAEWDAGAGLARILERFSACSLPTGEFMTVNTGATHGEGVVARGRYAGLDRDGSLLIEDEAGSLRRFTFGDVTLDRGSAGA